MEVKPGYKQTEVGVIPEEWEVKPWDWADYGRRHHAEQVRSEYIGRRPLKLRMSLSTISLNRNACS